MTKAYKDPELKVIKMTGEDILTDSTLEQISSGWETNPNVEGGGTVPFVTL